MTVSKTIKAAAAAALAVVVVGASPALSQIRIGYAPSVWDPSDFHGMMGSGIESGLKEHGIEYEFLIRAPSNHVAHEEQLAIVENLIAEGVDYIIVNPTDPILQRIVYERVIESGIPLIVGNYSEPFDEDWGFQPMMFTGYSHEEAGITLANYLHGIYGDGTEVTVIHGSPGYTTFARAPEKVYNDLNMTFLYEDFADYDRLKAYDAMERIIVTHPDVEVVIAASSAMAVGAVEAASANGLDGVYKIYGAGGTFEELRYIEEGVLAGAWIRDPVAMGIAVADAIKMHMDGREDEIELVFNSPIHIIDSIEAINEHVNPVLYTSEGMEFPRPLN